MTPWQQFVIELVKEGGKALSNNSAVILALLAALGVGVHIPQPGYMQKKEGP